jgi:hypothetical protein
MVRSVGGGGWSDLHRTACTLGKNEARTNQTLPQCQLAPIRIARKHGPTFERGELRTHVYAHAAAWQMSDAQGAHTAAHSADKVQADALECTPYMRTKSNADFC